MKKKNTGSAVLYNLPRRDAWCADLTEEARYDILCLRERMKADEAIKYIERTYGKKISRASYYRATSRLNANRIASAQLMAAATPPSLDVLEDLAKTARSIDSTLKDILKKMK